ncbi:MAG: hypothetical protein IJW59_05200 [Clostridia bacterium]|nr:hypothetical protein [Clostridia bacterium]
MGFIQEFRNRQSVKKLIEEEEFYKIKKVIKNRASKLKDRRDINVVNALENLHSSRFSMKYSNLTRFLGVALATSGIINHEDGIYQMIGTIGLGALLSIFSHVNYSWHREEFETTKDKLKHYIIDKTNDNSWNDVESETDLMKFGGNEVSDVVIDACVDEICKELI